MEKTGIIGFGSIGSIMAEAFLDSGAVKPSYFHISTRTIMKTTALKRKFPAIKIMKDNALIAGKCSIVFICVKPHDFEKVITEIRDSLTGKTHLVSVVGGWEIRDIEKYFSGKVSTACPSVLSSVLSGITTIMHNKKVGRRNAKNVEAMFKTIGGVSRVNSDTAGAYNNVTGCGPGLVAVVASELIKAAVKTGLNKKQAEMFVTELLRGTAEMKNSLGVSYDEIFGRVATKGGITEQGAKVLRKKLPAVFGEMFGKMFMRRKKS